MNHKSNNSLTSCFSKKIIDLIPLKSIQDLFTNHSIVKIDENGLCENSNKNEIKYGKVLFNIVIGNNNSQINDNYLKLDNKENSNNENNTIYLSNKIDPKINKSVSLFSIHYNKMTNNYVLTSFTDEVFFALEIWSNKNLYIEHSKRYYVQMSDIIISLNSNNINKNIKIKILNLKNEDNSGVKNKYIFDFNKVPITIGRNNCSINIEKNSISKVHLIINYDVNTNQFFLRDNFSTNGSFVLLKNGKEINLEDKMFFFLEKVHFILKR